MLSRVSCELGEISARTKSEIWSVSVYTGPGHGEIFPQHSYLKNLPSLSFSISLKMPLFMDLSGWFWHFLTNCTFERLSTLGPDGALVPGWHNPGLALVSCPRLLTCDWLILGTHWDMTYLDTTLDTLYESSGLDSGVNWALMAPLFSRNEEADKSFLTHSFHYGFVVTFLKQEDFDRVFRRL